MRNNKNKYESLSRAIVRLGCALVAAVVFVNTAGAADVAASYKGESVRDALYDLRKRGLLILYSSDVVTADLRVVEEPTADRLEEIARDLLAPHGLELIAGPAGRWLVVPSRRTKGTRTPESRTDASPADPVSEAPLAEIVVSAGHYPLGDMIVGTQYLSKEQIARMPHLADDPMRLMRQLPGIAGTDFSASMHVRGGALDETAILVDGVRIHDPFHLKGLQGALGLLDAGIIENIDVMTGGFGAEYGDRTSAIVSMRTLLPASERQTTVGISFVNAFARTQGALDDGRGHYLLSVRRGYLDWVFGLIDSDGEYTPRYWDAFAKADWAIGDATVITGSTLLARDELHFVDSEKTGDALLGGADSAYAWVSASTQWGRSLKSDTVLSWSGIDREQANSDEDRGMSAVVNDQRELRFAAVRSDWQWEAMPRLLFKFGGEARRASASYDYDLVSCLADPFPNGPCIDRSHSFHGEIEKDSYAAYLSTRWRVFDRMIMELGVRGDQQSYDEYSEYQVSPRAAMLFELADDSSLRLGWGYYYQSQQPDELLVQDRQTRLTPPERAEHRVISLEHRFSNALAMRAEVFEKLYDDLRARPENLLNPYEMIPEAELDRILLHPQSARIYGAELTLSGEPTDTFSWRFGYAWMRARDTFDTYTAPRSWDQTHTLNGSMNWILGDWNLNVFATAHTGWPTTPVAFEVVEGVYGPTILADVGQRNSDRLSTYSRVDVRLSRARQLSNGELTYFFELYNALSQENQCCVDDDLESYQQRVGVRYNAVYNDWLPLLPSFGVTWTFR